MNFDEKVQLITLLNEFKLAIPRLQEVDPVLTHHYNGINTQIEEATKRLKDKDYRHIEAVNELLTKLQFKRHISWDEYFKYYKRMPHGEGE